METNKLIVYGMLFASTLPAFCACWYFSRFLIEKNDPEKAKDWSKTVAFVARDGNYTLSQLRDIEQSYYKPYFKAACNWTVVSGVTFLIAWACAAWF